MSYKFPATLFSWITAAAIACSALALSYPASAQAPHAGLAAIRASCSGCHRETSSGHFERISDERKSPEGWAMTIYRMQHVHGARLTAKEQAVVIQYLSDVQGLAPSETAPARFALERRPNVPDMHLPDDLSVMCGRCHSLARVALQRRPASEWLKLINFHVGQFSFLEYQAGSRDMHWWKRATTRLPDELARLFPLDSTAWQKWREKPHADLSGTWIVHGHTPARGDYYGTAVISSTQRHGYLAHYSLRYTDGRALNGSSHALVYTGFQWRGTATLGGDSVREVYFASADESRITGRWFLASHNEIGGDWFAARASGPPALLAVLPAALKAGTTQRVILLGRNLRGSVNLGSGTTSAILERHDYGLVIRVSVAPGAPAGYHTVGVGDLRMTHSLAVYRHVVRLSVEPKLAIARLGGGSLAPVDAQFQAIGYTTVPGPHETLTYVRLGAMPATWTVAPFSDAAARRGDARLSGTLTQDGRFIPAEGGPNPERQYSDDNTGNLSVVATHTDGKTTVTGKAHLIVTIQRWINPPIY